MGTLLSRDEFHRQVFERDNGTCVICGKEAADAHHIIDRCLFEDGGYYIDNGVSLCPDDHLKAERTQISCKELRKKAHIQNIVLPEHLDVDEEWDHWANIILPVGARLRGELFYNENVQKALRDGGVIGDFLPYVKYPRTYHLPWSPNLQNDDRMHTNVDQLFQMPLIGTLKLDGENTTLYPGYIHARSIDSKHHESRAWIKALHGRIAHEIPQGWRICGENLFAKHSIHYHHLKDFFYVFSIWNEKNEALSWQDTVDYCEMLGLHTVPVFLEGISCKLLVEEAFEKYINGYPDDVEGYVLRFSGKIPYHTFKNRTAKFVRKNHVQTDEFWMTQPVVPNVLEANPVYNTDEMREILSTIEKSINDNELSSAHINSIRYIGNFYEFFDDSIKFKYKIESALKTLKDEDSKMGGWSYVPNEQVKVYLESIYDTVFCGLSKVPLKINGTLSEVAKLRMQLGK